MIHHLSTTSAQDRVFQCFLRDWNTKMEASCKYVELTLSKEPRENPYSTKKKPLPDFESDYEKYKKKGFKNHPTVIRIFKIFDKIDILEHERIAKQCQPKRKYKEPYMKSQMRFRISLPKVMVSFAWMRGYPFRYATIELIKKYGKNPNIKKTREDDKKTLLELKKELEILFGDEEIRNFFIKFYNERRDVDAFIMKIIDYVDFISTLYWPRIPREILDKIIGRANREFASEEEYKKHFENCWKEFGDILPVEDVISRKVLLWCIILRKFRGMCTEINDEENFLKNCQVSDMLTHGKTQQVPSWAPSIVRIERTE